MSILTPWSVAATTAPAPAAITRVSQHYLPLCRSLSPFVQRSRRHFRRRHPHHLLVHTCFPTIWYVASPPLLAYSSSLSQIRRSFVLLAPPPPPVPPPPTPSFFSRPLTLARQFPPSATRPKYPITRHSPGGTSVRDASPRLVSLKFVLCWEKGQNNKSTESFKKTKGHYRERLRLSSAWKGRKRRPDFPAVLHGVHTREIGTCKRIHPHSRLII